MEETANTEYDELYKSAQPQNAGDEMQGKQNKRKDY